MTAIISDEAAVATTKASVDTRTHLSMVLLGIALFVVGFLIDFERDPAYLAWSASCLVFNVYTVYSLFAHRMLLFSTLSLCLTYGVTIVWISNYVMDVPMSSWRKGWEAGYGFPQALGESIQYLTYFSILSFIAIRFLPANRIGPFNPVGEGYRFPVLALTGISGLALIATTGLQGRNQYAQAAGIESKFVMQASSIMLVALFAFTMFFVPSGTYRKVISSILVGTALIVGANGFRFILVFFAFIWLSYILSTRKLSMRWVLLMSAGAVIGYLFLLTLDYTRAHGMTFGEALAFAGHPDLNAVLSVGASDQTNLIAQNYYSSQQGRDNLLFGQTYLDAFLRLAPNEVHTWFFHTVRPQDYIIETGSFIPDSFRRTNLNIGSHLFVEAIINFGRIGPYIVLPVFVVVLALLEKLARNSYSLFLGYVVLASMGSSLAWYGFSNSLKEGIYAFICAAIIILSGRLLAREGNSRRSF